MKNNIYKMNETMYKELCKALKTRNEKEVVSYINNEFGLSTTITHIRCH